MEIGHDVTQFIVSKDELVVRLDEIDMLIRHEIAQELKSETSLESGWLACLLRARADIQSAITSLLGGAA